MNFNATTPQQHSNMHAWKKGLTEVTSMEACVEIGGERYEDWYDEESGTTFVKYATEC